MSDEAFTPMQQKMMARLRKDNKKPVPWEQLWACLEDEMAPKANLEAHVNLLRRRLREMRARETVATLRIEGTDNGVRRVHYSLVEIDLPVVKSF